MAGSITAALSQTAAATAVMLDWADRAYECGSWDSLEVVAVERSVDVSWDGTCMANMLICDVLPESSGWCSVPAFHCI
jgi:hypothetical protein